jgi:hypothetical protein
VKTNTLMRSLVRCLMGILMCGLAITLMALIAVFNVSGGFS